MNGTCEAVLVVHPSHLLTRNHTFVFHKFSKQPLVLSRMAQLREHEPPGEKLSKEKRVCLFSTPLVCLHRLLPSLTTTKHKTQFEKIGESWQKWELALEFAYRPGSLLNDRSHKRELGANSNLSLWPSEAIFERKTWFSCVLVMRIVSQTKNYP